MSCDAILIDMRLGKGIDERDEYWIARKHGFVGIQQQFRFTHD